MSKNLDQRIKDAEAELAEVRERYQNSSWRMGDFYRGLIHECEVHLRSLYQRKAEGE